MKISMFFLLIFAIGSHQQNVLNGMSPPKFFDSYYNSHLPHYQENLEYNMIPSISFGRQHQSFLYPNYDESSLSSPYWFLNSYPKRDDYEFSNDDDSSTLFRNLPDGRDSNKYQKQNLNGASNLIKSSIQMNMPEMYNNDALMQRQLFQLFRPRNLLYTLATSTIDITSTVTCVPSSVSMATTPNPASTTTDLSTAASTSTTAGLPFIRSNASLDSINAPPLQSLETPVVLDDRSRLFREKNDMIKDILLSSLEDILEENYRYNNRRKRMFFRYPAQTTLTSYVLNSVTVTNTFTPNGVDCPPPGYIIC